MYKTATLFPGCGREIAKGGPVPDRLAAPPAQEFYRPGGTQPGWTRSVVMLVA